MSQAARDKTLLLNRLRRLRGQIAAIERAVDDGGECATVLQQATSARGALDGFIAEVVEDHIREHMAGPDAKREGPGAATVEELVDIVHQYLRK